MIIAAAHLQAAGHHQEPEAVGYRAVLIRFAGWTLHLITLYLDCGFAIDEGPSATRTQAVANIIRVISVPWMIVGDFNRSPEEVAGSVWCKCMKRNCPCPRHPFHLH